MEEVNKPFVADVVKPMNNIESEPTVIAQTSLTIYKGDMTIALDGADAETIVKIIKGIMGE